MSFQMLFHFYIAVLHIFDVPEVCSINKLNLTNCSVLISQITYPQINVLSTLMLHYAS